MQVQVKVQTASPHTWHPLSDGWWSGHVHDQGHWLSLAEVEEALRGIQSANDLIQLLNRWNGHFAFLWSRGELHLAATDIARSIPVFWQVNSGSITLSNQLIADQSTPNWWQTTTALAQAEFVPGHNTLWQNWQQLQAGEILEVKNGLCYLHNYFPHRRPASPEHPTGEWEEDLEKVIENITERLISFAAGRTIILPLSGGYDSRIIAAALYQQGYTKLKAFTYGLATSTEVRIAQTIAERLRIDWTFVPYQPELIQQFGETEWSAFASYAAQGCSLPQEQDFFALLHLKNRDWLPPGSIICPGYCGDFQAGSYLPGPQLPWPPNRKRRLQEQLLARFVRQPDATTHQMWRPLLPQVDITDNEQYVSELEHWVLREYVSKYIVNGVRAYEWFECDWHLPLWDLEFIRFWQRVPNEMRQNMQLYRHVLQEKWFKPHNIVFPEDNIVTGSRFSPANWLPPQWKKRIKNYLPTKNTVDVNGLQQLIPLIQHQLSWPATDLSRSVNEMIGYWYHDFINNKSV